MPMQLIVTHPFASYVVGQVITDTGEVESLSVGPNAGKVVRTFVDAPPEPGPAPEAAPDASDADPAPVSRSGRLGKPGA